MKEEVVVGSVEVRQTEAVVGSVEVRQTEAVVGSVEVRQTEVVVGSVEVRQTEAVVGSVEVRQTEAVVGSVEVRQTEAVVGSVAISTQEKERCCSFDERLISSEIWSQYWTSTEFFVLSFIEYVFRFANIAAMGFFLCMCYKEEFSIHENTSKFINWFGFKTV